MGRMRNKKKDRLAKKTQSFRERSSPGLALHPHTKRAIWGVLLVTVAVLLFLSFFIEVGLVGRFVARTAVTLFGVGRYFLPVFLLFAAGIFFLSERKHVYLSTLVGASLLFLASIGLVEGFSTQHQWGGGIGRIIFSPLQYFVGEVGAVILLLAFFIIALLILFNIPLGKKKKEETSPILITALKPSKKGAFNFPPFFKKMPFSRPSGFKVKTIKGEIKDEEGAIMRDDFATKTSSVKDGLPGDFEIKSRVRYRRPQLELFDDDSGEPTSGDIKANAAIIKRTLQNFGIEVDMGEVNVGPTVTQYTLKPAQGVKLSRITVLGSDLSLALASHPLRIEAPIPGKSLVGIEIPNRRAQLVRLRPLLGSQEFGALSFPLILILGRDVSGNPIFADLGKMPHLLIAGSTGSGKTIALNTIILSLIYRNSPKMLRFVLIDPKRVEFPVYDGIPHLLTPVITNVSRTVNVLRWAVGEMDRRFDALSQAKARDIISYNQELIRRRGQEKEERELMPYLVIIIDELADLMAARGREVEASIVRLAQMARAVGIHLVVATQRPSVEVITGLIKANITSRIAFQVASQIDSRTILDSAGSEKLLGNGDMLFVSAETSKPRRIQGAYVSEKEILRVTQSIKENYGEARYDEEITEFKGGGESSPSGQEEDFDMYGDSDPLLEDAKREIRRARKASASFLQRRLRIGYARAARILDLLEEEGVVGPGEGAKPREVFLEEEEHGGS